MTTDELITKLADLNIKLNPKNKTTNIKLVFAGVEDERDPIITKILFDDFSEKHTQNKYKSVYDYYLKQIKLMNKHYKIYNNNIDFIFIVEKIIKILLKNYKLYSNIKSPKGHLINYLFRKSINGFPNRIWAMFQKYMFEFEEMQGYESFNANWENAVDESEAEFYSSSANAFDLEYYVSGMNQHIQNAEIISEKGLLQKEENWYKEDNIEGESENTLLLSTGKCTTLLIEMCTT